MVSHRITTVRLKVSLVLLATLVNSIAALPTMWLQNDLIGNHFLQHQQPVSKTRHPQHVQVVQAFPSFAFPSDRSSHSSPVAASHLSQPAVASHTEEQPQWWKNLISDQNNFNVEETRHVRSQLNSDAEKEDGGRHLKDFESLPMDLFDYSDLSSHDGPELSAEDQEFLLNSLAEGMELQTNLENLLKSNRGGHQGMQRRRRSRA